MFFKEYRSFTNTGYVIWSKGHNSGSMKGAEGKKCKLKIVLSLNNKFKP